MKMKLKTVLILLGLLLFLSASIQSSKAEKTYGITNVTKTPQNLEQNKNMTVTVEFEDGTQFVLVKLLVCQLEPVYRCDAFPRIMQNITDDIYIADYLIQFDVGTVVGFTIIITFENFTQYQLPNSAEFLGLEIVEPETGSFYIAAGTVNEIEETTGVGLFSFSIVIIIISITFKRKKKTN
jgi:hypothetical protein